jgi:hypothetical protein
MHRNNQTERDLKNDNCVYSNTRLALIVFGNLLGNCMQRDVQCRIPHLNKSAKLGTYHVKMRLQNLNLLFKKAAKRKKFQQMSCQYASTIYYCSYILQYLQVQVLAINQRWYPV